MLCGNERRISGVLLLFGAWVAEFRVLGLLL